MNDPRQTAPDAVGLIQHKLSVPDVPERLVPRPRINTVLGTLIERRQVVLAAQGGEHPGRDSTHA
jgi:hypothetical protein